MKQIRNEKVLSHLVTTVEIISQHNFIPSLIVIGGIILAFHYETVVELYGGCPITVAVGEPETGKSTAIRAGLALGGMDEKGAMLKAPMQLSCKGQVDQACHFVLKKPAVKQSPDQIQISLIFRSSL